MILPEKDLVHKLCHHIYDLAKMSKQQLTGEQLQTFITRSNELMSSLSKTAFNKQLSLGSYIFFNS